MWGAARAGAGRLRLPADARWTRLERSCCSTSSTTSCPAPRSAACTRRPRRRYARSSATAGRGRPRSAARALTARDRRPDGLQLAQLGARRAGAAAEGLEGRRRLVGRRPAASSASGGRRLRRSHGPVLRLDHDPSALEDRPRVARGPGAARRRGRSRGIPARKRAASASDFNGRGRDHQHLRQGSRPRARRRASATACGCTRTSRAEFDAWDIDSTYALMPVELDAAGEDRRLVAAGPLAASLKIERAAERFLDDARRPPARRTAAAWISTRGSTGTRRTSC